MQFNDLLLIEFALGVPLLAAFVAAIIPYRNVRDPLVILISTALPFFIYKIHGNFIAGVTQEWRLFEVASAIAMHFKIEALGLLFASILAVLWVISLIYSVGYMRGNHEGNLCRFFAFFNLSIFAALGVAFAGNLLTLFIFYELLTFATYPLVAHHRTEKSRKAGRVYLGVLVGTSMLFFLPAIIFTYNIAGTLDFTAGGILLDKIPPIATMLLFGLFILGIAKAALMPLHKWLPAAMVAEAPVSALLHAVAVVKAGVFSIIKITVYIFGIDNLAKISADMGDYGDWVLYIAGFTVIAAGVVALTKDNLKLRLAYSTISQLAYVVLMIGLFSYKGVVAAAVQVVSHAFGKFVMFASVGAVYTKTHKKKASEIAGVGKFMPLTMACFAVAALSLIGLPPTVGFFTKWYIFDGAIAAEQYAIIGVIAISTMLNAAYFLPVIYNAFFEKEKITSETLLSKKYCASQGLMDVAILLAASAVVLLFLCPDKMLELAGMIGK